MSQSNNVVASALNTNLSNELKERIQKLQRDGQTFNECLEQVVSLGCYQLEYRRENGEVRKAKQKEMRIKARLVDDVISKDPELAVKFGLGTRVAL